MNSKREKKIFLFVLLCFLFIPYQSVFTQTQPEVGELLPFVNDPIVLIEGVLVDRSLSSVAIVPELEEITVDYIHKLLVNAPVVFSQEIHNLFSFYPVVVFGIAEDGEYSINWRYQFSGILLVYWSEDTVVYIGDPDKAWRPE